MTERSNDAVWNMILPTSTVDNQAEAFCSHRNSVKRAHVPDPALALMKKDLQSSPAAEDSQTERGRVQRDTGRLLERWRPCGPVCSQLRPFSCLAAAAGRANNLPSLQSPFGGRSRCFSPYMRITSGVPHHLPTHTLQVLSDLPAGHGQTKR
ncbi:hypothetical protein FQA47_010140 [Oryzias melastigma]|uniref:Uncharacterized protein n=1 Tax=Oryzias melastigma TaxID=30732 RepID=A0A834KWT8_ORYME|nr:hypothetical protein FQA47_010140 [Oryzias melastigma]